MDPERWRRVKELCHEAAARAPDDRAAFLAEACDDDVGLRCEVEALLAAESEADDFLASAAWRLPTLAPATRLGPYEVVALVGAGGMGDVYKARDRRLGRDVAIKVLPESFAADPDRVSRFAKEARATATLSHPNVLAIYDIGTHAGQPYLVEELLEGQTLRQALTDRPFPPATAIGYARQIARGLAAAHAKGLVHRDLKPENVFLTSDGQIKIFDFGLAKLVARPSVAGDAITCVGSDPRGGVPSATGPVVLGTVGYMSPEQARGQAVDARTDVFAFGCVLYEMLAGQRAFQRDSAAETLSAILNDPPPPLPSGLREISPALVGIVARCLEKEARDRYVSAFDVARALEALEGAPGASTPAAAMKALVRKPLVALPLAAVVLIGAFALARWFEHRSTLEWARTQAVPEILRLADEGKTLQALVLARDIEDRLPESPLLQDVWPKVAMDVPLRVTPTGATVRARSLTGPDDEWVQLGLADGQPIRIPLGAWAFRFDHPGYESFEMAQAAFMLGGTQVALSEPDEIPPGMVRVNTGGAVVAFGMNYFNYERLSEAPVDTFFIDKYEVTNAEYRQFVEAGGYERREFWTRAFVDDGREVSWAEAMALFRDRTGRPGPATWEVGDFPEGRGDYPVGGVSWYEAAAYAEFVGKRLPTIYHWELASGVGFAGVVVPGSNFSEHLAPVGSFRGSLNASGLYDTAGSVREWCANATGNDRFALGGAADDPAYLFVYPDARPPLDRNLTNGFRLMSVSDETVNLAALEQPLRKKPPVVADSAMVVDDAAWKTWRSFLDYPDSPLDAKVELSEAAPLWQMEKVTMAAAYAGDRLIAYLFLPADTPPPYQVVVYWPGAYVWFFRSSADGKALGDRLFWDYVVRDGRALVYPILKGTFERHSDVLIGELFTFEARDRLWASRDLTIMKVKDIARVLDYVETRPDLDATKVALLAFSSGAYQAPLACATDPRLKTCLLVCGGAPYPEVLGFARRVTIPVQMVNGKFDSMLPYEEIQRPLFEALGTRDKKHVRFDTDHQLSGFHDEMVRVNLEWLDRYLGPVRGGAAATDATTGGRR